MTRYLCTFLCMLPVFVQAHYIPSPETPILVNASLAATWRSDDLVQEYDFWQVPGTMMGGDSWPAEKGVQIDEMKLGLGVRVDQNIYAVLEVGSHASGSDDHSAVDLEHAYLGYVCCEETGPWVLEIGRMVGAFSPSLSSHASDRLASEAPLIEDVFFGRNFHDDGARFMWHTESLIAGVEVWKGDAFPATSSGGTAWDVFARYTWNSGGLKLSSGAWWYQSSAEARSDHRYGGSHQHTPVAPPGVTALTFPDTRFTGDSELYGVNADASYQTENKHWTLGFKTEFMHMDMDGILHDDIGRIASIDAKQMGAWAQPYITFKAHTIGVRAEWLSTDNQITGAAASQLSIDSGLANPNEFEPSRYSAIWLWQWRNNIALRTELIEDKSLPDDQLRFAVGVVWKQALWPFNGTGHQH